MKIADKCRKWDIYMSYIYMIIPLTKTIYLMLTMNSHSFS